MHSHALIRGDDGPLLCYPFVAEDHEVDVLLAGFWAPGGMVVESPGTSSWNSSMVKGWPSLISVIRVCTETIHVLPARVRHLIRHTLLGKVPGKLACCLCAGILSSMA